MDCVEGAGVALDLEWLKAVSDEEYIEFLSDVMAELIIAGRV